MKRLKKNKIVGIALGIAVLIILIMLGVSACSSHADSNLKKGAESSAVCEVESSKADGSKGEKPAVKPVDRTAEKQAAEKAAADKAAAAEKAKAEAEAKRAAALLGAGKPEAAKPAAAAGQHVILIGAFANPGNVKVLQTKLNEIGVKSYTENLDSPQGAKTRVRAGPFPSKEAAEKALDKMKKIGVNGIVSAK